MVHKRHLTLTISRSDVTSGGSKILNLPCSLASLEFCGQFVTLVSLVSFVSFVSLVTHATNVLFLGGHQGSFSCKHDQRWSMLTVAETSLLKNV